MRYLLINILVVVCAVAGCGFIIYRAHKQVKQDYAIPTAPPKIVMVNIPAWMPDSLADQIVKSIAPTDPKSAIDPDLLKSIAQDLGANPWVRSVERVERVYENSPGDTIQIRCVFRAPSAFFHHGEKLYLVDSQGVRLPDTFSDKPLPEFVRDVNGKITLRIVFGMTSPPPKPGAVWQGKDIQAGLDLVKTLFDQPFARDILSINVTNYGGRISAIAPQIVLHTQFNTEIRWGEPIAQDYHAEIKPAQKIQRLQQIDAKYGRIDANHSWVDIRLDKATFPATEAAGLQAAAE
jgi:hypothetical protein